MTESEIKYLKDQLKGMCQLYRAAALERDACRAVNTELSKGLEELKRQLSAMTAERDWYITQLADMKYERDVEAGKERMLRKENLELIQERKDLTAERDALRDRVAADADRGVIDDLKIDELKRHFVEMTAERDELKGHLDKADDDHVWLNQERDDLMGQLAEVTAERDDLKRKLEYMRKVTWSKIPSLCDESKFDAKPDPLEFTEKPRSLTEYVRDLARRVKRLEKS